MGSIVEDQDGGAEVDDPIEDLTDDESAWPKPSAELDQPLPGDPECAGDPEFAGSSPVMIPSVSGAEPATSLASSDVLGDAKPAATACNSDAAHSTTAFADDVPMTPPAAVRTATLDDSPPAAVRTATLDELLLSAPCGLVEEEEEDEGVDEGADDDEVEAIDGSLAASCAEDVERLNGCTLRESDLWARVRTSAVRRECNEIRALRLPAATINRMTRLHPDLQTRSSEAMNLISSSAVLLLQAIVKNAARRTSKTTGVVKLADIRTTCLSVQELQFLQPLSATLDDSAFSVAGRAAATVPAEEQDGPATSVNGQRRHMASLFQHNAAPVTEGLPEDVAAGAKDDEEVAQRQVEDAGDEGLAPVTKSAQTSGAANTKKTKKVASGTKKVGSKAPAVSGTAALMKLMHKGGAESLRDDATGDRACEGPQKDEIDREAGADSPAEDQTPHKEKPISSSGGMKRMAPPSAEKGTPKAPRRAKGEKPDGQTAGAGQNLMSFFKRSEPVVESVGVVEDGVGDVGDGVVG